MLLKNYYWTFEGALSHKFCDDVIQYALSKKEETAKTFGEIGQEDLDKEQNFKLKQIRNSDVVWLNDTWIYKEIHPFIKAANKNAGWNFDWLVSEPCQFTKYKLNQYYDWHADQFHEPYKEGEFKGLVRKLSVTCQLTDGSEYEGGELEFDYRDYSPNKRDELRHVMKANEILKKGSIVVFPSCIWHRVKPVRKGTRYSLVIWNVGHPYR